MKYFIFYFCSILCFGQQLSYFEDFEKMSFGKIQNQNWITKNIRGNNFWRVSSHKKSSTKLYAKMSGYNGGDQEEDWLILKQDLSNCYQASFEFESAVGFFKHNGLTVWISDSENFSSGHKIDSVHIASKKDIGQYSFSPFIPSGKIDISSYCGGNFYLGFRYLGNNTTASTVYEIDNIKIWVND